MPLEIKELHIKAIVENASESNGSAQAGNSANNEDPGEQLIRACVERVMELIKEAKER